VDSFKIEGRLKSAEYVATVTRIYRKYIDMYMETGGIKIAYEDMHDLTQIFNRGGFTTGYLDGNPGRKILSGKSPKNQGIFAGKVCGISKEIKNKGQDKGRGKERCKTLIDVKPSASGSIQINMGDGVEIRSGGDAAELFTTGNIVTYFKQLGGGVIRIGDFDKGISPGDEVYKVTDKVLNAKALLAPDKKIPLSMMFEAEIGEKPVLEIREIASKTAGYGTPGPVRVRGDFECEKALSKPTDRLRIEEQLSKLGDTPFESADIRINIDQNIMIPVSVINHMRRDAVQRLLEEKHFRRDKITGIKAGGIQVSKSKRDNTKCGDFAPLSMELVPLEEFMKDPGAGKLPYILNVSRGVIDEYIEKNFDAIVSATKSTGIAIGNLGWVKQFLDAGVTVYGDYGLNAYNAECVRAYEELGIKMIRMSHETADSAKTGSDVRFGGRIPLMITEHPLETDYLIDRKGVKHDVIHLGDKHLIF
jgi:putative protease